MKLRPARIPDMPQVCDLINHYAEQGLMLHRSLESAYTDVREFHVAEDNSTIVGCVALDVIWRDMAEIKSLAVAPQCRGTGIGLALARAGVANARRLGAGEIFVLTYEQAFFEKMGFRLIDRGALPEKTWQECIACPKVDACDEIAMLLELLD